MTMEGSKDSWPPLVPMGTLPLTPSLINQIITSGTPVDDTKNHVWLRPLALAEPSPHHFPSGMEASRFVKSIPKGVPMNYPRDEEVIRKGPTRVGVILSFIGWGGG